MKSRQVESSASILTPVEWVQQYEGLCEFIARTARRSWAKLGSNPQFLRQRIDAGEENVVEHAVISVLFTVSRSIAQQLTRHRIASYCGDSLRIGTDEHTWIMPEFKSDEAKDIFAEHMQACVDVYARLLELGEKAEDARDALPLGTAHSLVATLNLRSWRNVFKKRALSKRAQPAHRKLMLELLHEFAAAMPNIFGDQEEAVQ